MLQHKSINSKKNITFYFVLIITLGLVLRLYYTPYDLPIVTDGFFSFVYATETIFQNNLVVHHRSILNGHPLV